MPRFRFPLEQLLRLRAHGERRARRRLAECVGEVARLDGRITELMQGIERLADEATRTPVAAGLAEALAVNLRQQRLRAEQARLHAVAAADVARTEYQQRRADHESLLRLRTARHADWRDAELTREQHELEELARLANAARQEVAR